jgi:hypothetical protein
MTDAEKTETTRGLVTTAVNSRCVSFDFRTLGAPESKAIELVIMEDSKTVVFARRDKALRR